MSRDNPLAMLNLDAHPLNIELIATEKKAKVSQEKLGHETTNGSTSVADHLGRKNMWHHKSPEALEEFIAKNSSTDNDTFDLRNFGDICKSCESVKTVRKFRPSTYDVAKNETWGSSMAPNSVFDVICKDCGDTETRNE